MNSPKEPSEPQRRGLAEKRLAITRAARSVFGRDGYTRASIDVIAMEAGVSTRTIYNHFSGKEELFSHLIGESATQVADTLTEIIQLHLHTVADVEDALVALGRAWVTAQSNFGDHFAMVRQINAEVRFFPQVILETWQDAGPRRVERELARQMKQLADQGLLAIADSTRAADHFLLLTVGEINNRSFYGAIPLDDAEIDEIVTAGVRAFLNGYLPTRTGVVRAARPGGGPKTPKGAPEGARDC